MNPNAIGNVTSLPRPTPVPAARRSSSSAADSITAYSTAAKRVAETVKRVAHHGYHLSYVVKCSCGETLYEGNLDEKVAASDMEDA